MARTTTKMDKSFLYMKEDISTIFCSLRNLAVGKDDRKISNLLESLNSFFVINKAQQLSRLNLDFFANIKYLDSLYRQVLAEESTTSNDATKLDRLELQYLILGNVRLLLKHTNNYSSNEFGETFEHLVDYLADIKVNLNALTITDSNRNIRILLEALALMLLKIIAFISVKCTFQLPEINRPNIAARFLGVIRCFSFYGLDDFEVNLFPLTLYPSPVAQNVSKEADMANKKRKSKGAAVDNNLELKDDQQDGQLFNTSSIAFSASEYSSSEMDDDTVKDIIAKYSTQHRKIFARIRTLAYDCLQEALPIFEVRVVFGFWSFFFPDQFNLTRPDRPGRHDQFSVLYTILHDPSNRVRTSALHFMYHFFDYGKMFVRILVSETTGSSSWTGAAGAHHQRHHRSTKTTTTSKAFTPLSDSLTSMVKQLHLFFEHALPRETNAGLLIMLYKVLSLIVSITPYHRLAGDVLVPLFERNSFLLDHKVTQIRNLALLLYVKIFTQETIPTELRLWLTTSGNGRKIIEKVFKTCIEFTSNVDYVLLSIEAIKLLTSLIKHHQLMTELFNLAEVDIRLEQLTKLSIDIIDNEKAFGNRVLQNLASKFLYALGTYLKHSSAPGRDQAEVLEDQPKKFDFIGDWFRAVFRSRLCFLAFEDDAGMKMIMKSTKVTLINVIALMPEEVFEAHQVDMKFQMSLLSFLARTNVPEEDEEEVSTAARLVESDEDAECYIYVQSAAIRCLTILLAYRCMTEDSNRLFDTLDICLEVLEDRGQRDRTQKKKAIFQLEHFLWGLANLVDIIKKNELTEEMQLDGLERLMLFLEQAFDVNQLGYHTDYILVNLVRCTGLALFIYFRKKSNAVLDALALDLVEHLIELLKSKKHFKLQWNLCIAFSYVMPLEQFIALTNSTGKRTPPGVTVLMALYRSLFELFQVSANHKVQSYSIYTITTAYTLQHFDAEELWTTMVDKFEHEFNLVSVPSQPSWLDKFYQAFDRLWKHLNEKNISVDAASFLRFLDSEMTTSDKAANSLTKFKYLFN